MDDTIDTNAVERYLKCAICKGYLTKPKLLPCSHAFCRDCIKELYNKRENTTNECACPNCRGLFVLDYRGVDGLQPFFQAQGILSERCIDNKQGSACEHCRKRPIAGNCRTCREEICKKCIQKHQEYDDLRKHETVTYNATEGSTKNKTRYVYSPTFGSNEEYDKLRKIKNELTDLHSHMEYYLKKLQNRAISFKEEKDRSKSEIKSYINSLKTKLDQEEEIIIDKLNDEYESERTKFNQQSERVRGWTKDVNDLIGCIMPKLNDEPEPPECPTSEDIFCSFDKIKRNSTNLDDLEKAIEIAFIPNKDFAFAQKCSLGEIKVINPFKISNVHANEKRTSYVDPRRSLTLSSTFKSKNSQGTGRCHQESPEHPPNWNKSFSFSSSKQGKLTGITISPDNTIYVINSTCKECQQFEMDGRLLGTFRGTLKDPLDVAIFTDDDGVDVVLVTDHGDGNNGIKIMRAEGDVSSRDFQILTSHPTKPMGVTFLPSPDHDRIEILTCDAEDKLIKSYNRKGQLLRCIGQKYSTLFKWPLYLTIFKMKYLAITDNCLQTVFIIDMDTSNMITRIQHEHFSPAKTCVLPDGSLLIGDNSHTLAHKATTNILNERRKNREIQFTVRFPSEPIALAANDTVLCVACRDGIIHVLSLRTKMPLVQRSEATDEYFV